MRWTCLLILAVLGCVACTPISRPIPAPVRYGWELREFQGRPYWLQTIDY
jgi:hypothetical protein